MAECGQTKPYNHSIDYDHVATDAKQHLNYYYTSFIKLKFSDLVLITLMQVVIMQQHTQ